MRVIGIATSSGTYRKKYICEITTDEINSIMNNAYNSKEYNSMDELKSGQEIDLANGYRFYNEIKRVLEKFEESHKAFLTANNTLYEFTQLMHD